MFFEDMTLSRSGNVYANRTANFKWIHPASNLTNGTGCIAIRVCDLGPEIYLGFSCPEQHVVIVLDVKTSLTLVHTDVPIWGSALPLIQPGTVIRFQIVTEDGELSLEVDDTFFGVIATVPGLSTYTFPGIGLGPGAAVGLLSDCD